MNSFHWIGASALAVVAAVGLTASPDEKAEPAKTGAPVAQAAAQAPVAAGPAARAPLVRASAAGVRRVDYARLDARLGRLMGEPAMVGLAVGVVENGQVTFLKGYGETERGSGDMVTPATVFRWASVSKGLAATMVAKLAEDGEVSFESPLVHFAASLKLPEGAETRATVGDLLSHRLGLYRNAYDNKLEEGQPSPHLRRTLSELNLICPPGTCWSYQNVAYDAATEIVEKLSGARFEEAVGRRLFRPLGMTSASVSREGLVGAPSWARPHDAARRPLEVNDNYYRVPSAGGVNSDIKDLALWMVAQMGGNPGVVSPDVLAAIHAPIVKTPGERRRMRKFVERVSDPHYGYGWRSYDYAGHRIVGHHGGVAGYRALIMFDPRRKSGVVALWNSNTSQPAGLEFEVMDMILGLPRRDWLELDGKPDRKAPAPDRDSSAAIASSEDRPARRG